MKPASVSKTMKRRHGYVSTKPGRERRHRAAAGDEAGDDDQVAAAFVERLLRPLQAFLRLLAGEEAPLDARAEEVAEREGDVVARRSRPSAAARMQRPTLRPPVLATTPAAIAVASLGTIGKNASSIAIAKTIR